MTLRHLRIFRQVGKIGSVTKTAADFGMTQPSVSVVINELENFYGIKLFDRMNRKMYLTPAGEN
jgi:DNA-binding transcriptional LysR family regulator